MATWYKTNKWDAKIEPVEVVRETNKCVFILTRGGEQRKDKVGEFGIYHPTIDAARAHLIEKREAKVQSLRHQLLDVELQLAELRSAAPPERGEG